MAIKRVERDMNKRLSGTAKHTKTIYLDYAATTPTHPEVVKAMLPYFSDHFGNPSSMHAFGQTAKSAIEGSRETIASLLGATSEELIFTSGGTESNNTALKGIAYANSDKGNHIITSNIEHHSILEPCAFLEKQGFDVTYVRVDEFGVVAPEDVKEVITDKTILISLMHANNEIGTIQSIAEIGAIAKERGIYFHTDAVQTFGHLPVPMDNVDLLSISAHKLYGPKGVGALYIREGTKMLPFMHGGDQERGRRASTHNAPGIVGFGRAVELARETMDEEEKRLTALRNKLITGIVERIDHTRLNGHALKRLPNNVNVSVAYIEGEAMMVHLDLNGVACSTGSACTSSSLEPSHVLLAIGLSHELARGSLRFTLGRYTEEEDIEYVLDVLPEVVKNLRALSPLYKKG